MPLRGDIKVNEKTHPHGTPIDDIYDFEIWDGGKWIAACTAIDLLYKVGSGSSCGLNELIQEK
jgi:hypothetical protein